MRHFNTAGPVRPRLHYHIPPLQRLDVEQVLTLIRQEKYFVLHAPRQTGKTTTLLALRDLLNGGNNGAFRCVYVNVESGQTARGDVERTMRVVLGGLASQARATLGDGTLDDLWPGVLERHGPDAALGEALARWAAADAAPLVLLIDEIDALVGDGLLSVLRQLRTGYPDRPARFPQTVVLCGLRDVRDYRIQPSDGGPPIAGGSPFNIKAESLRLGDFSRDDVGALLRQHTAETGQKFTEAALDDMWAQTQGQPWLVNALADQACFRNPAEADHNREVDVDDIRNAQERLILARDAHLDQLTHKLREGRVQRVIEPLLSGTDPIEAIPEDDLDYVRDLGLVSDTPPIRIANPIYREVIPRSLTYTTQEGLSQDPAWYVDAEGQLQVGKLLAAFQAYFREHSEHWVERFQYKEAGPQLLLQAFLQRIVNGGGRIEREYSLGRRRTDLLIIWPLSSDPLRTQKAVIECKLLHRSLEQTIEEGLAQIRAYMDRCAADEGHLVILDRTEGKTWAEKVFYRQPGAADASIAVWGI